MYFGFVPFLPAVYEYDLPLCWLLKLFLVSEKKCLSMSIADTLATVSVLIFPRVPCFIICNLMQFL